MMSTVSWPDTLPVMLRLEGLNETLGNNLIRSEMDSGPVKVRRRSTAAPDDISGTMVLTSVQTDVLDEFYLHALAGGALPFLMRHPRTQALNRFRIKKPPTYTPAQGLWIAGLTLEKLP